jgi:hypothetical protein
MGLAAAHCENKNTTSAPNHLTLRLIFPNMVISLDFWYERNQRLGNALRLTVEQNSHQCG